MIGVGMTVAVVLSLAACGRSEAPDPASSRLWLALVGRGNIPRAYIDGSPKGSSPGDSYVYRGSLANQNHKRVGRLSPPRRRPGPDGSVWYTPRGRESSADSIPGRAKPTTSHWGTSRRLTA